MADLRVGAAYQVRADDQSEDGEADRSDDPAERAGAADKVIK